MDPEWYTTIWFSFFSRFVLQFDLFFHIIYSSTQFKMVPILFLFPCSFSSVCAPHCYMQIVLQNILYSYVPNTNEETYFHPITC
jgi:hypothetical protein